MSQDYVIDLARRELRCNGSLVPIGSRSLEVLEVLTLSAGSIVSRHELIARVWPGAIVQENTVQVHISAIRRALGTQRGLLHTLAGQGYRLNGKWTVLKTVNSAKPQFYVPPWSDKRSHAPSAGGNIPFGHVQLFGRATAVEELQELSTAHRIITLVGPGGIGKTVLALEVVRQLIKDIPSHVIELGAVTDPQFVPASVVRPLDLKLGAAFPTNLSVANAIGAQRLLLLIDNCEHIRSAATLLVEAISSTCPAVSVIATSREPLRAAGEYIYRIPALDTAATGPQLFLARLRSLQPAYNFSSDDVKDASGICDSLDGNPLAIEFAAARAAELGIRHTRSSLLENMFETLTRGRRTAFARHKTFRAALDWSYDLLPANEKRLLRFLAAFSGGFTAEAAAAILGAPDHAAAVQADLESLADKSLISLDRPTDIVRWRLSSTTRTYSLEKLVKAGEANTAARRHTDYFCAVINGKEKPAESDLAERIKELGNVRSALGLVP